MSRSDIAVVVIGRNEGARLDRCLASLRDERTVYVDSASIDGSADRARATGVEVIELDQADGLSAARGRNAGIARLIADPAIAYLQMLDGDCVLDPGWTARAAAALDADPGLGAVSGVLRERDADGSIYSWMFDAEWATAPGPALVFGGIVMLRAEAIRDTGDYHATMIAGEDPDYAIRLRAAGWRIQVLGVPMATHDAGTTRFSGWWRRTVRSGHGFAELNRRHPAAGAHHYARNERRIIWWGGLVPLLAIGGIGLAVLRDVRWIALPVAMLLLVAVQILRVGLRESRHAPPHRAFALALFLAIGKYAEMIGMIRYHLDRRSGRPARLIEHKAR